MDRSVQSCVSEHIRGGRKGVPGDAGFRQARERRSLIGKDLLYDRTGWAAVDTAARIIGKHPLLIPPCREWFALFGLCKAGAVQLGSFAASRALTSLFRLTPSSAARSASAR